MAQRLNYRPLGSIYEESNFIVGRFARNIGICVYAEVTKLPGLPLRKQPHPWLPPTI